MIGTRERIAISCARRIFLIVSGHHEPAFTVAPFATTTTSLPSTRPTTVTTPAAGVVIVVGRVEGREVVVVANGATVKAGSWWPETIKKILRAQEIAMRSRVPIIYLVDSAGVNLPYQGGVFPGQYGASRIFY